MTKDEALKLAMEAMEITGGFDVEILAIKEALAEQYSKDKEQAKTDSFVRQLDEALAQSEPWEKFCDSNCVWTDHHPDCKLAEQEPVACVEYIPCCTDQTCPKCKAATPPQRKPLTAMEVYDVVHDADLDWHTGFALGEDENRFVVFARAIEAAHGIKGEA